MCVVQGDVLLPSCGRSFGVSTIYGALHNCWPDVWCLICAGPTQKKAPKGSKRKTRQARALEQVASTKKAPRSFLDLLQEVK